MPKTIDLLAQKFGLLTVVARGASDGHGSVWICVCECGRQTQSRGYSLRTGHTRSCGCLLDKWRKGRPKRFNKNEHSRRYREVNAEKIRAYAIANSARIVARVKAWRLKNRERYLEQQRRSKRTYREANPEKRKATFAAWYYGQDKKSRVARSKQWALKNPGRVKEMGRKYGARARDVLADHYVARLIYQEHPGMRASDIPAPLIEAKRVHLKVKRLLKEMQS